MKILLLPSKMMDSKNEIDLVRCSKETRDRFKLNSINLNKKFQIKKAFAQDINRIQNLIHKIDETFSNKVFFVTSDILKQFTTKDHFIFNTEYKNKKKNEFLIGTDPELLLFDQNNVVRANSISGLSNTSKFGSDGAMAEIRPDPAIKPEHLIKNIKNIFSSNLSIDKNFIWKSICYHEDNRRDYPVGAHIHFDNPNKIKLLSSSHKNNLYAVTNKILDELLTIPLIRLDGKNGHKRRARCKMSPLGGFGSRYGKGYGYYGEWRGQAGRLEYRSLSGLIISSPELCTNIFGTGKAIVEAVYNKAIQNSLNSDFILPAQFNLKEIYNKNFNNWSDIPLSEEFNCNLPSSIMQLLMDNSDRRIISQNYIKSWHQRIKNLSTYTKYKIYIDKLSNFLAQSSNDLNNININLKETWEIE